MELYADCFQLLFDALDQEDESKMHQSVSKAQEGSKLFEEARRVSVVKLTKNKVFKGVFVSAVGASEELGISYGNTLQIYQMDDNVRIRYVKQ